MRFTRVARLAAEFEVDADVFADGGQALEDQGGFLGAEFLGVVGAFVGAGTRGGGVEVEGEPGCGEGIGGLGVQVSVGGDAGFEFLFADVALEGKVSWWGLKGEWRSWRMEGVTHGQTVSETMEMLKLVILRRVWWNARVIFSEGVLW